MLLALEELLRGKLLPVVVEGLPGDRDIGIYPSQFPPVAPGGHVSPEAEQVSSPGSCSSTHLEAHDDDDDDDATAIDTEIQSSDHDEVPIERVTQTIRPSSNTYDAIVASEGKIVEAENRRHSDLMTVLQRMISLQEQTISQLAHLHRVFIEVPKQMQKINTSLEAMVVQQTQANYLRMTTVPDFNFNTSQAGSLHAVYRNADTGENHALYHQEVAIIQQANDSCFKDYVKYYIPCQPYEERTDDMPSSMGDSQKHLKDQCERNQANMWTLYRLQHKAYSAQAAMGDSPANEDKMKDAAPHILVGFSVCTQRGHIGMPVVVAVPRERQ
ncbi:uncharacterized protein LOC142502201 [Ascaphus truei]|uniref:uncharacterized protein LOC142502201 n=1 Tax=Ascaphus truei TaxID=8439 RepID=UPI003F59AE79